MGDYCPFISAAAGTYDLIKAPCMREQCKFWDATSEECILLLSAQKQAAGESVNIEPLINELEALNTKVDILSDTSLASYEVASDIHDAVTDIDETLDTIKDDDSVTTRLDDLNTNVEVLRESNINDIVDELQKLNTRINIMKQSGLQSLDALYLELAILTSFYLDMNAISDHLHTQHMHPYPHKTAEIDERSGGKSIAMLPDPTAILMQEFNSGRDVDGNGMIYGTDFKIKDNDIKPKLLLLIEANENWSNPSTEIDYEEYLESIEWPRIYETEDSTS